MSEIIGKDKKQSRTWKSARIQVQGKLLHDNHPHTPLQIYKEKQKLKTGIDKW